MSAIKQKIRNVRYGTTIHSALTAGEHIMFQNVIPCSDNKGRLWCGAVVGLTDKRLLIEWQRNKGKDVAIPYDQIISWQVGNKIGGISEIVNKLLPFNYIVVDICVNEQLTIRASGQNSVMGVFVNHLKRYCPEKQK